MEEDDEFGDLYTDVLIPLTTSSTPHPPPIQSRTIDLNIQSDDEEIIFETPNSKKLNFNLSHQNPKILVFEPFKEPSSIAAGSFDSHRNLAEEVGKKEDLIGLGKKLEESDSPGRVLESGGEVKLQERGFGNSNFTDERDGKDEILEGRTENFEKFDIEEGNTEMGDMGLEPTFLGLSIPGVSDSVENRGDANFARMGEGSGEGDDWDSDSEDDLQIVLNDNNHGPMAMERSGVVGADEEDDDEDGEPLVIVADNDPNHQPTEEQDWGEDAAQVADGERKELGDAAKVNGGVLQPPKLGFSSHGYHPFHSQFKYVRPGAAPMPGAAPLAPGGVPGQLRPLVNMGPIAGRGRGDWRSTGIKNAPLMQKSFYPGYGMPVWGNNAPGRGLEFTLPSHKTIFEVDIDSFEEKPWKLPGIGISDFFNFDLNEETWKDYCKQLEQLRLEATMQSKIRVYESGRTEQEYDPDMPPELAAAAGIHDVSSENANLGREDAGQSDLAKGSARVRPQLPTGRAIQVETGYGERLPSIDTRPPRIRDSDAIIEIVLQDSADDDSFHGNDVAEPPDIDPSREDLSRGHEIEEEIAQEDSKHLASMPQDYNDRKRVLEVRRVPLKNSVQDNVTEGDGISPFLSEAPVPYYPNSRGQTPVYPGRNFSVPRHERWTKGRAHDTSPQRNPSKSTQDFLDNQKEESVESVDGKHSPPLSSPITVGTAEEKDSEPKDVMHDELVLADGNSEMEALDTTTTTDTLKDENLMNSVKKKKLSSQVEQSYPQEICDGEDLKAARSSENSKARSGSSRDTRDLRDADGEEFVQDGRSTRIGISKRPLSEDEHSVRSKGRDERQEMERHVSMKGREDSYYRKNWDSNSAHRSHMKTESIDRRKESDNSDGAWQRKDEDPHGGRTRAEDMRKRERGNEMASRHRSKVQENESSDKHDQLRKQLDDSSWRGHHDKEMGSRHRDRDDNLKTRNENSDGLHSKRKKEEAYFRRDHAEKEVPHVPRESTSHRKRERDDILDQRKRDDQVRPRDDNQHSVRHKEEAWFQRERVERQRERDEWHRLKQSHEESLSKREREEGQGGVRSGRAAEDKAWVSHSRLKDDYKGSDREYHFKDTGRHSEQLKKRDRVDNESLARHGGSVDVYARGNQLNSEERRSRQERASSRSDHAASVSDNHRVPEKKHKENTRKSKESAGDRSSLAPSRRNQQDNSGPISERVRLRGKIEQGSGEHQVPVNRQPSRKHREDASSDDELQDSRRGRSKLERWTSHKEIDFSIGTKSSSLHVKELDGYKNGGSSLATILPDESSKRVETVDNSHPLANDKDGGDLEIKNVDAKPTDDRHLDTVAKLKKRSERFKLPMPSEKEAMAIKKMENEPLPLAQTETHADSEIKHERPARKRRWTSN